MPLLLKCSATSDQMQCNIGRNAMEHQTKHSVSYREIRLVLYENKPDSLINIRYSASSYSEYAVLFSILTVWNKVVVRGNGLLLSF